MPLEELTTDETIASCVSATPTYWSEADVLAGKMIYLPTGRIAKLHRVEPDGRKVLITPTGHLLCEHGERPSTILSWIAKEARAKKDGVEPPLRNSQCTCQNTDGMYFCKSNPMPEQLPVAPESLYSFLEELGTHKIVVQGRVSRHVPFTTGKKAMYLTQKGGHFVCRHAHSLTTLRKMRKMRCETLACGLNGTRKFRGGLCDCELDNLPHRTGLKNLPKLSMLPGKWGELR